MRHDAPARLDPLLVGRVARSSIVGRAHQAVRRLRTRPGPGARGPALGFGKGRGRESARRRTAYPRHRPRPQGPSPWQAASPPHPRPPHPRRSTGGGTGTGTSRAKTRTWTPPGDAFELGLVLGPLRRGPADPTFRTAPDGSAVRATRTPAGPGTLRVRSAGDGTVHAEAWGPGADWLLERLPEMLGASDDPAAFVPRHRLLAASQRRRPGLRLCRTGLVLESLIPSILEQKVTTIEANRAWSHLVRKFGEPAPARTANRPTAVGTAGCTSCPTPAHGP